MFIESSNDVILEFFIAFEILNLLQLENSLLPNTVLDILKPFFIIIRKSRRVS